MIIRYLWAHILIWLLTWGFQVQITGTADHVKMLPWGNSVLRIPLRMPSFFLFVRHRDVWSDILAAGSYLGDSQRHSWLWVVTCPYTSWRCFRSSGRTIADNEIWSLPTTILSCDRPFPIHLRLDYLGANLSHTWRCCWVTIWLGNQGNLRIRWLWLGDLLRQISSRTRDALNLRAILWTGCSGPNEMRC
jgi:hypothetical protein